MRLIDADVVQQKIEKLFFDWEPKGMWREISVLFQMAFMVKGCPTIDAVPVVRCKDCKHYGGVVTAYTCRLHSTGNTRIQMNKDDFCSRGERRV